MLRFVRTGEVISSALLDKSAGEVLELVVAAKSHIAGVPLKDAKFPRDAVLGVLVRGGQVIMARGDSVPLPGDLAIVFSATESVPEVERAFSPR
ncbi:MAG: potassium transporter peripheral membrane component [Actinobacteria bacterium ADurb.Bin444]|nr:MAG: potassium transporter peripheral membrane component [Actinobacteria bacterium ADurb.Bin444]